MFASTSMFDRDAGRISLLPLVGLALLSFFLMIALPQVPDPLLSQADDLALGRLPTAASGAVVEPQRAMHQN